MENKDLINEELKRFNNILSYNVENGNLINERKVRQPWQYNEDVISEAEPGEEEGAESDTEPPTEEGGENTDFDFGDEGSPEEEVVEPTDEEETEAEDEFGTASEFSAADDLESAEDEEVEEIDVTAIVKGSDEAKEIAQQAVSVGQENMTYLQSLTDKLSNLEAQISKMNTIASKIGKLEQAIKTPEEKLELRSLDSYPFNLKLSDYWEEKSEDSRYIISTGEEVSNGEKKEYILTPEELDADYSEEEIKNTFNPNQQ